MGNALTEEIWKSISLMPALKTLNLRMNLIEHVPSRLAESLPALQMLDLAYNAFSFPTVEELMESLTRLSELPRLRDLDLSNNAFWSKIRDLNRALTEQEENHFMSYFFESRLKRFNGHSFVKERGLQQQNIRNEYFVNELEESAVLDSSGGGGPVVLREAMVLERQSVDRAKRKERREQNLLQEGSQGGGVY